ncbi:MAG: polymer-forming cytoskeletal protein [Chlorobi bacterium]|nr:polymer-forming cytoskeletal protein [Chlorobiota bacterium]
MGRNKRQEEINFITEGAQLEGTLSTDAPTRIDGFFKGEINVRNRLVTGETSQIEGDIEADEIIIAGKVNGMIRAKVILRLTASAKIEGKLITPKLIIEEGAVFNGECKMTETSEELPKEDILGEESTQLEGTQ